MAGGQAARKQPPPVWGEPAPWRQNCAPGQHDGIVVREVWESVQESLATNGRERRSPTNTKSGSFLAGKLFDETGDRLVVTAAQKGGKRYRYYTSQRLVRKSEGVRDGWRVPAQQLERAVAKGVTGWLIDPVRLSEALGRLSAGQIEAALGRAAELASRLDAGTAHRSEVLVAIVARVTLCQDRLKIEVSRSVLLERLMDGTAPVDGQVGEVVTIDVPIEFQRRGVEARLVMRSDPAAEPDEKLVALVERSHRWLDQLTSGEMGSIRQIAQAEGKDESDVSRFLPLAFLEPGIADEITRGDQPSLLTMEWLRASCPLPHCWTAQRQCLTS